MNQKVGAGAYMNAEYGPGAGAANDVQLSSCAEIGTRACIDSDSGALSSQLRRPLGNPFSV